MYEDGIPCLWMRGGSSKAAVFLATDLPSDRETLHALLLRVMGSPDIRQIDGIGGGDPLTSKVAIISPSTRDDADVDYYFLQVFVDQALVSDAQGCGNILAAVGPAAIERGLVKPQDGTTEVRIHMVNTGEVATSVLQTPSGKITYAGTASIAAVPGAHAPVPLLFENIAGSMCGALLPTGNQVDEINGVAVTLVDNGMPCVIIKASDLGMDGTESIDEIESNQSLKSRVEDIRLKSGHLMGLGDVTSASVPKMFLVSKAIHGGSLNTRCFIPHRVHASVGVLAAITAATACLFDRGPASECASLPTDGRFVIEHPSGSTEVFLEQNADGIVTRAGSIRTARKLFDGRVFI